MTEVTKPIPVTAPGNNQLLFSIRCLFDVQLGSIVEYLRPYLNDCDGKLLDVGAGQMPWVDWINERTEYIGLDVEAADSFGMTHSENLIYYDGGNFPFDDNSIDSCICIEVLEHTIDPDLLLNEIFRVLKPGGTLLLTVPWSARRHHTPFDFQRFTLEGLENKFDKTGFSTVEIFDRGNELGVIANKTMVLFMRLLSSGSIISRVVLFPFAIFSGLVSAFFLVAYNISKFIKLGRSYDPLGYAVKAKK